MTIGVFMFVLFVVVGVVGVVLFLWDLVVKVRDGLRRQPPAVGVAETYHDNPVFDWEAECPELRAA